VATAPARKTVRPERAAVVMAANGMISGEARALAEHALGEHPAMLLQRFRDARPDRDFPPLSYSGAPS